MLRKFLRVVTILSMFVAANYAAEKKSSLTITDIDGKSYIVGGTENGLKISGTEGKVVILEFFGNHCPPCLMSIPHLVNIQKRHADKLQVLAVEVQGLTTEALKRFVKSHGINYPVFSGRKEHLFVNYIAQRAQWGGSIPFTLILDPKGEVQYIQAGLIPEEVLEKIFRELSRK